MELFILIIAMIVVFLTFRKIKKLVYFIVFADILLRVISFVKENITNQDIYIFLNDHIPLSIPNIIDNSISGTLNEIFIWAYVGLYILFEYYILRDFFKKK